MLNKISSLKGFSSHIIGRNLIIVLFSSSLLTGLSASNIIKNTAIEPVSKTTVWKAGNGKKWSGFSPKENWVDRHEAKKARMAEGNVDLIFIGDSITHGWDFEIGKKAWDKYYAHRNAVSLGYRSDRTQHVIWRLENGEIDGISPKVAVVMIGTNNTNINTVSETVQGITKVCETLRTKLPDTKILLLGIFPRGKYKGDARRYKNVRVNSEISSIADGTNIVYLDISREFLTKKGNLVKSVMSDYLHPTSKGYEIWARAMEPQLKILMEE